MTAKKINYVINYLRTPTAVILFLILSWIVLLGIFCRPSGYCGPCACIIKTEPLPLGTCAIIASIYWTGASIYLGLLVVGQLIKEIEGREKEKY